MDLREEIEKTLAEIEKQIDVVVEEADAMGISVHKMRTHLGGWVMSDLLVAKAKMLNALTFLRSEGT